MTYRYTIDAKIKGIALTEWVLKPQDRVIIRWISGYWSSQPHVPPPSYDANGNPNYAAKDGYLYPRTNDGRLIACIGEPAVAKFAVGNYGIVGDGTNAGQLWVAINDDWNDTYGPGYSDNVGSIVIEVELERGLEATAFALTVDDDRGIEFLPAEKASAHQG